MRPPAPPGQYHACGYNPADPLGLSAWSLPPNPKAVHAPPYSKTEKKKCDQQISPPGQGGAPAQVLEKAANQQVGIVLGVLSAIAAAFLTIENRRVGSDYPLMTFLFYEIAASFVIMSALLPLYLSFFPVETIVPSTSDLIYLLILSSFCTVGMFSLQVEALKRLSAFTVNLSYNLEPVYSIILAMIIFNEAKDLNFAFYIGLALICISVLLQSYFHWKTYQKVQKAVANRAR